MPEEKRERSTGDGIRDEPAAPAEPAKVHGDMLDDLIPRDLRPVEADEAPRAHPERADRATDARDG